MRRFISLTTTAVLVLAALGSSILAAPPAPGDTRSPVLAQSAVSESQAPAQLAPVAIGAMRQYGAHLRPPSKDVLMAELRTEGLPLDATPAEIRASAQTYLRRFAKQSETWTSASFQEQAVKREAELASPTVSVQAVQPVTATVFAMAIDFGATETFTLPVEQADGSCLTQTVAITGPLQGQVPLPPATDNFTLWYSPTVTANAKFYEKLIFGYEGAGRTRFDLTDPDDGQPGINLAGYTVQDYYDNVAGDGNVYITGTVEGWVTVPHSEGYYGANNCATGSVYGGAGVPVAQLVIDAIDVFSATHSTYWTDPNFWPRFDANHDGILDTFWVIHGGQGEESGGGEEGIFAIWSHSSDLRNYARWPSGYKVYEGDPGTAADDIYVGPYTMQPENADIGVLTEEFGHNFFGLPDLYTQDANNSVGDWTNMSGGSWMGWLGGTTPASMPLWFKMIAAFETGGTFTPVNWHQPMITRSYTDTTGSVTIGQLEKTPDGVNKGVRVNLPAYSETIDNLAGTGKSAYSGTGRDQTDILLSKQLSVGAAATGTLTLDVYYEIEEDWDYGYVMVNGATIPDMDGVTTNTDPNGNNLGNGITGASEGTLRFDLSAYRGQTITVILRYKTDAATTEAGWWVDNVQLDGTLIDDLEGATLPGTFDKWTNSDPGWYVVPSTATYNHYYLVEWRAKTKYDKMLKTAYVHKYSDATHGDVVDRVPYNIPAAVVYYRNTKYSATYAMRPNESDPPSFGSKYQLLVVDMNWFPLRIGTTPATYKGYWTGRLSSHDAALTMQATEPFTITGYYGLPGEGPWAYPSRPAVTTLNDTLGYYGGFYFGSPCRAGYLCYMERDGSAVIPGRDLYSARISNFAGDPIPSLYGIEWTPSWLGTGDPGDDNTQWGVNIDLLSKDGDDAYNSTATLRFRNYSVDIVTTERHSVLPDTTQVTYETVISNLGSQTAMHLELDYWLDGRLSPVSLTVSGPGAVGDHVQQVNPAGQNPNFVGLDIPEVPAGEQVTVTVVTRMPTLAHVATPSRQVELLTEIDANDGQVSRGPWFIDTVLTPTVLYFPIMWRDH